MKNIIIAIIVSVVSFSFAFSSIASEDIDISEEAVKSRIILDNANTRYAKSGIFVKKIRNVKIIAKEGKQTQLGIINYYVVTAEMKHSKANYFSKCVFYVYTVQNGDRKMVCVDNFSTKPTNVERMKQYEVKLAEFTQRAEVMDNHENILLKFAIGAV